MKKAKAVKRNGWLSLLLVNIISMIDFMSARINTPTDIKTSWIKNLFLVSVVMLFASILTGNVFFIVFAILICAAISGIRLSSSRGDNNHNLNGDNHNYGSNGSNGSDGSTGS
ncbi:hypothetical protein PUG46_06795 [Erwiniaceae bacterium L1_55_4]|nr:hypothetical protein [Erwiniaceae bacterium L1_55_4]